MAARPIKIGNTGLAGNNYAGPEKGTHEAESQPGSSGPECGHNLGAQLFAGHKRKRVKISLGPPRPKS